MASMNLHPVNALRIGWRVFCGRPAGSVTIPNGTTMPGVFRVWGDVAVDLEDGCELFCGEVETWGQVTLSEHVHPSVLLDHDKED